MSLFVPPASFTAYESNLTTPSTTLGTSVAASATPHAKNTTYTTLIASTAFDAYAIQVIFSEVFASATRTSLLVDLAIGGVGAETVVIPNLNAGYAGAAPGSNATGGQKYWFPFLIPVGSRLSATAQGAVVSDTVRVAVWLWGEPKYPVWAGSQVVDYGTDLANSAGTAVVAGTSAAEGSWTEIVSATTQDHYFFAAGVGLASDTDVPSSHAYLDVGIGAAAAEAAIMENLAFGQGNNEQLTYFHPFGIYNSVASGTRLAARASLASATAQSYDTILYGLS